MHHRTEMQFLRVPAHCVAGQHDDNPRDHVSFWSSIARLAEPDPHEPRAPPDDTHTCMLQVVANPGPAPAMFSKRIDAAPSGDNSGVEKFLRAPRSTDPVLPDEEHECHDDAISDERGTHDEVG